MKPPSVVTSISNVAAAGESVGEGEGASEGGSVAGTTVGLAVGVAVGERLGTAVGGALARGLGDGCEVPQATLARQATTKVAIRKERLTGAVNTGFSDAASERGKPAACP